MNDRFSENEFLAEKHSSQFSFSIGKAFVVAFIIIICLQFVASVINLPAFFEPAFYHVTLPLSFLVGGLLSVFVLIPFVKTNWKDILAHIKMPVEWVVVGLSILLYFLILPFAEFSASLIPTTGNELLEMFYKEIIKGFEMMLDYKVAGFITVCILAPFFEEILFRGILLRGLLQHNIHPVIAITFSAFLFGMAHLNPWQFMGAGMLGAVFGFVYYRTKSLWICVFLHALNNTISFLMMIKYGTMEESVTNSNQLFIVLGGLLLALIVGWGIFKLTKNKAIWN